MKWIMGVDESGTGAFAGSFYVAAVLAPAGWHLEGVRDSKKTTAAHRLRMVEAMEQALVLHTEVAATPDDIFRWGHAKAYLRAFEEAVTEMKKYVGPEDSVEVIMDGREQFPLKRVLNSLKLPHKFLIKADAFVQQVSAASIFAKFNRDVEMNLLDIQFPQYKFSKNAGYGSAEHRAAIKKYGAIEHVHRPLVRR